MKNRYLWLPAVIILLISGCSNSSQVNPTLALNQSTMPKIIQTMTSTEATSTFTPPPTSTLTPTLTLQPSAIWTAQATWSAQDGLENMLNLINGEDNCRLPCWGGIIPGQSNWQQSLQNLAPLAGVSKFTTILDGQCTFGKCNYLSWLYYSPPDFEVDGEIHSILQNDKVYRVSIKVIRSSPPEGMSLTDILNNYGMPPSVLMDVNQNTQFEPNTNGVAATILLLLAYPKNNFVIIFYYDADLRANKFISCSKAKSVQLFIYDDGARLASDKSLVNVPDVYRLRVTGWKKLEDVTNLQIDSFFTTYKTARPPCIETPVNDW
jgi:hypothetical protein